MHKNLVEQDKPIGGKGYTYVRMTVFFAHLEEG